MRVGQVASLSLLVLALLSTGSPSTQAQSFGLGLNGEDSSKPIDIEADNGIEWQQNNRVYIARGHAKATRGQSTIYADTLMAFYRPVCGSGATARSESGGNAPHAAPVGKAASKTTTGKSPAAPRTGATTAKDAPAGPTKTCPTPSASPPKQAGAKSGGDDSGGSTEVYRLEADGHVRITTETQTAYGDHAVYDVDQTVLVLTGKNLKLVTPRDQVTARDSLEWYDNKQLAVARGDAVAIQQLKRLRGDVLTAQVVKGPNESSHISRIDASGNVLVSSPGQIARGDTGVYDVDSGIATLTGRVTLTRADNELRGQYAVVDLNNNVSRLLSAPPSAQLAGKPPRVEGLLVPRSKPQSPAQ